MFIEFHLVSFITEYIGIFIVVKEFLFPQCFTQHFTNKYFLDVIFLLRFPTFITFITNFSISTYTTSFRNIDINRYNTQAIVIRFLET